MGQPFAIGFSELEPFMRPLFEEAIRSGAAQDVVEAPMMVERNNYIEEAFFTGNFNPLRGLDGEVVALYNALFEVTRQKIHDRRKDMLNMLTTPESLSTEAVYSHIIASLATDPHDVSMAILHELQENTTSRKTKLHARGQLGVPEQHALTLGEQGLDDTIGIMPFCKKSMDGRVVFEPGPLFDGVQWRGFKKAPKQVVTMSLRTQSRLFGFLTIGTNPFRPLDESYEEFIKDLSGTASNLLAAALDADTLRRDQQQLQNDLQFSNMKIRHLVDHASVGMAHAKPGGELLWANDKFFTLASPPSGKADAIQSIFGLFSSDDQEKARMVWTRIFAGEEHVSAEFCLQQSYMPPVGESVPAQIQLLAFPFREHGVPVSGMVCVTDISHLKWAESWQARIAQDAHDAKRQQEAFIDTVSHEVRNPLSAIVHCADSILLAFDDVYAKEDMSKIPIAVFDVLRDNTAAASVILDCCKHQKRIVDDVLTLSRLESSLLSVNPTATKPAELVDSIMAMFSAELRSKAINTQVIAEPSIQDLDVDHLQLDSSRVVQIFINLLTNAIKFMDTKAEKELSIRYGATRSPPRSGKEATSFPAGLHWAPKGRKEADDVDSPAWGTGEILYLTFCLSDTGIGMRQEEVGKVFKRFEVRVEYTNCM
jgi:signal transduction histidine kinase